MLDAVPYFFTNLLLLNVLLALMAFILGLLLGRLLWAKYKNQIDALKKQQESDAAEIQRLKDKLAACEAKKSGGDSQQLNNELAQCKSKCASLQSEVDSLSSAAASAPAPAPTPVVAPIPAGLSESQAKSRAFFDADIASGKMRDDETYGLLYNMQPNAEDDLTKIHGVAGVLNKTLNENGVYTYRQIALWTPQICSDFSEKLAFPGRVERDDWIGQCKKFHQEKYGEEI